MYCSVLQIQHKGTEVKLRHAATTSPSQIKKKRNRVIRTVTILDVQWKKSRSFFALILKLKAECCVCSSAFILCGSYVLPGVQIKRKKRKKGKKNTIFARGSQPSEIVGVLYRMKMKRKGFSTGRWWGRAFSSSSVGDGSEKREAVILSRVCPGEGVLVLLFYV